LMLSTRAAFCAAAEDDNSIRIPRYFPTPVMIS
jgi:hypothetical protein